MKQAFLVTLLIILGNNFIAQNFTGYPCPNCGGLNGLYTDTTVNKLYINGLIYPSQDQYANGMIAFENEHFVPISGFPAISSIDACRFNGELYIAGDFYSADSTDSYTLIKWDGTNAIPVMVQGQAFNNDIGSVYRLEVLNNELYITGIFRFMDSDGIMVNGIAKLVSGEFKSIHNFPQWNTAGINFVKCITIFQNELYVAGGITDNFPADTMRHICKWNGTNWQMLGNGITGSITQVTDIQEFQGKLYIGGTFTDPGRNLAVWNGSSWEQTADVYCSLVGYGGVINSIKVYNNELYIGGIFNSVAGIPASNFAKFDGNEWCTFLNDSLGDVVSAIEVYNDELYLAGALTNVGGINYPVNVIAKLNSTGTIYTCIDVVGLDEQKNETQVEIFPNPTSGIFELKNGSGIDAISVLDLSGKLVKEFNDLIESETGNIQLDISDLPTGFYNVVLFSKDETTTMKLIKK